MSSTGEVTIQIDKDDASKILTEGSIFYTKINGTPYGSHMIFIGSHDMNFMPNRRENITRTEIDKAIEKYKLQESDFYGEKIPGAGVIILKDSSGFNFVFVYIGTYREDTYQFVYTDLL